MLLTFAIQVGIILFHHYETHTWLTNAQIQTVPQWDNTTACQSEHIQNGWINLQGNPYHECSLQVLAPSNNLIVIEMPDKSIENDAFFCIERMSEFAGCLNKYVLIEGESQSCSAVFAENYMYLMLVLYGNQVI